MRTVVKLPAVRHHSFISFLRDVLKETSKTLQYFHEEKQNASFFLREPHTEVIVTYNTISLIVLKRADLVNIEGCHGIKKS